MVAIIASSPDVNASPQAGDVLGVAWIVLVQLNFAIAPRLGFLHEI